MGISGASGSIYGIRLLERLHRTAGVESHLVLTRGGEKTAFVETGLLAAGIKQLADHSYPIEDIGSRLASPGAILEFTYLATEKNGPPR